VVLGQYGLAKERYEEVLDLNFYGLEGRGLMAIIPGVEDMPNLTILLLRKNNLTVSCRQDTPVVYLCSRLESARTPLKTLDLSENTALTDKAGLAVYTYASRLRTLLTAVFEEVQLSLAVTQKLSAVTKANKTAK
jgi:hypothetical protein